MSNPQDRISRIVNKVHQGVFNATKGRVGGRLFGMDLVALTTTGRTTGQRRTSMVGAPIVEDGRVVVVASFNGAPNHPQWYLNLLANPEVEIVLKGNSRVMTARVAAGNERDELWSQLVALHKDFDKYQSKTTREIPIVVLEPQG
jgi:deazaflavin-dependent oxidoreductase (nitroreductase family)